MVYSVQCTVCSVQCAVCIVHFEVFIVNFALYIRHCEICSLQCAVLCVQCPLYSVRCAVCSVQCAGGNGQSSQLLLRLQASRLSWRTEHATPPLRHSATPPPLNCPTRPRCRRVSHLAPGPDKEVRNMEQKGGGEVSSSRGPDILDKDWPWTTDPHFSPSRVLNTFV